MEKETMANQPTIMRPACGECARAEQDAYGFDSVAVVPMGFNWLGAYTCHACRAIPQRYYLVDVRHSAGAVS